ncbi:hypothetical protein E2C01_056038 [Portunus trituberculatus]|uniref:Uncharacterized protein n=1 Tax=Portunus trituberculatus TaxID=210409 RepID=A0A5B7GWT0_PORTR|nr:hypothetical protein [Portunus trituberculatus]
MVQCERCSINGKTFGKTSVCTLSLDSECACVFECSRCEGLMQSAVVGVVPSPVCCVASGPQGVFVATPAHSYSKPTALAHNTDLCSKRLSICLGNRCLETAGLTESLALPGTLQQLSPSTHRTGPRKYCSLHLPCLSGRS